MAWTKERLGELLGSRLPPAQVDAALGHASIVAVKSCTGEVNISSGFQQLTAVSLPAGGC